MFGLVTVLIAINYHTYTNVPHSSKIAKYVPTYNIAMCISLEPRPSAHAFPLCACMCQIFMKQYSSVNLFRMYTYRHKLGGVTAVFFAGSCILPRPL